MTDLIKREDAIKVIEETPFIRRPILQHYIKAKIKQIPSAENKGEWIPCSERLPEESGMYLCTCNDGYDNRTTFVKYQKRFNRWAQGLDKLTFWNLCFHLQ